MGPNSGLHIIIFDEIDAICKARGSVAGSSAVHDTVVNQLLSKIDGVDQLNNILVIGQYLYLKLIPICAYFGYNTQTSNIAIIITGSPF